MVVSKRLNTPKNKLNTRKNTLRKGHKTPNKRLNTSYTSSKWINYLKNKLNNHSQSILERERAFLVYCCWCCNNKLLFCAPKILTGVNSIGVTHLERYLRLEWFWTVLQLWGSWAFNTDFLRESFLLFEASSDFTAVNDGCACGYAR